MADSSKKIVVVVFGGVSTEHDISVISGIQAIENIDTRFYKIIPVYWTKDNNFITCSDYSSPKSILKKILEEKINVSWNTSSHAVDLRSKSFFKGSKKIKPYVILPALHGGWGEDGNFAGLLEILDIPFAGSNCGPSFLSMDKNIFKNLMKASGVGILPWQLIGKNDRAPKVAFKYPVICKPNSLGSSIGVAKCNNLKQVGDALDLIFELDEKAIIEPYVEDLIEINCSVLGNGTNVKASVCERPISKNEILNFEEKYLAGSKSKTGSKTAGMAALDRVIPADISDELSDKVQNISKQVFSTLSCTGLVRVDCIYSKKTRKLVVNEVNSIPGSFSFYLWEASGLSFRELLDKLFEIAVENHQAKRAIKKTFESSVLDNFLG